MVKKMFIFYFFIIAVCWPFLASGAASQAVLLELEIMPSLLNINMDDDLLDKVDKMIDEGAFNYNIIKPVVLDEKIIDGVVVQTTVSGQKDSNIIFSTF